MDFLLNASFQDFDEFADQARDWQLDFIQLDAGPAEFRLMQAGIGGFQIARARFNRKLVQRGSTPRNALTLVIPVNPALDIEWLGHRVTGDDLMVFPEHGELSSVSLPGFDVIVYSVPLGELARLCDREELRGLHAPPDGGNVTRLAKRAMASLRRRARLCTDALADGAIPDRILADAVCHDLLLDILHGLAAHRGVIGPTPSPRRRAACLSAALERIDALGWECLTIAQLCRDTNCSERTLQYAFRERFGVGPKAYLQAWRLNQVRRALRQAATTDRTIADIANLHGFWHMGQFAADYRRMFHELPGETRRRYSAPTSITVSSGSGR